jgi:hypothetical protein
MTKFFYDLEDENYYIAKSKKDEIDGGEVFSIYILDLENQKLHFVLPLRPYELKRRFDEGEIRKLNNKEEAKIRLLYKEQI